MDWLTEKDQPYMQQQTRLTVGSKTSGQTCVNTIRGVDHGADDGTAGASLDQHPAEGGSIVASWHSDHDRRGDARFSREWRMRSVSIVR